MSTFDETQALRIVREALGQGLALPCAASGPRQITHILNEAGLLPTIFSGEAGRRRLHATLLSLEQSGKISRQTHVKPNRHVSENWLLTEDVAHARLIAAAPELLEALRVTVAAMIALELSDSSRAEWAAALAHGRRVLAKATAP